MMAGKIKSLVLAIMFVAGGAFHCLGQTVRVAGRVMDDREGGVATASVVVLRPADNRLLGFSVTDSLGRFAVEYGGKGMSAVLVVSHIAYRNDTLELSGRGDTTVTVRMRPFAREIGEATVRGRRPPIQYKDGDMIVNVENFIGKGTDRSVDLLRKLPGVFVNEMTKRITLNGKPVELQFDGRLQPVTFELLKALPANLLDQIVLVPNKRAEHDGDPEAAIINVKTKKKFIDGYVGNIEGNYGLYPNFDWAGEPQGSAFVMLMKKKFYLNIMCNPRLELNKENISDSTYYGDKGGYVANRQVITDKPWAMSTNVNLSWDVHKGHRINANIYEFTKNSNEHSLTNSLNSTRDRGLYDVKTDRNHWNVSGNVEYESSDSLPFKLKISYGYVNAGGNIRNGNEYLYTDQSVRAYVYRNRFVGGQHISKVDFREMFLKKKLVLNAGVKVSVGKTTNDSKYDPSSEHLTNEYFDYRERVATGYVSLAGNVSRKISLNAGIRAEYTDYDLRLASIVERGGNTYWNLLPSAGVVLNLHKNYNTSLSFSSAIGRPNYDLLAPKERWYDERNYSRGNPFLQPYKSYSLAWGNSFFRKVYLNLGGRYAKDQYNQVLLDKGNDVTETTYLNCFDSWQTSANLSIPLDFLEGRLSLNLEGDWKYGKYRNIRNGFSLPAGRNRMEEISASVDIDYWLTKQYRFKIFGSAFYSILSKSFLQDTEPYAYANIGIRYKCMEKRSLFVSFFATDIFNSLKERNTYYYGNNIRVRSYHLQMRSFSVGLSYSFQGGKDLKREEKAVDANAEDKRFDEK